MTTRNLSIAMLLAFASTGVFCAPSAQARTFVDIGINVAPPPPRYERVVVRPGYVWVPGHYNWDGRYRRYVWVGGYYVADRHGHRWVPAHWQQGPRGGWHFRPGHWT
ncbi:MAG: YXWGXW repeat-containing protein [Proteobacteria bacterium]|nr:YXWGXW repeat-containing protein [Pseudomonadota bacterium]